ncbi:uncharacterized protein LOC111271866 [Varroa jacobsoni]|uniref:uncharacterized protein LOC111271866 n=1 Tax=Varroa jacobsoni TaxID=62625 RepID=UPI000BF6A500|nr:uncharacterized protein LOC111271866 [Varroa jacobsoni]
MKQWTAHTPDLANLYDLLKLRVQTTTEFRAFICSDYSIGILSHLKHPPSEAHNRDIFIFTPDYLIICNSFTRYPFASNQPDSVKVGQVEQSLIVQKSSIFVDDFSYRAIKDQIIDA